MYGDGGKWKRVKCPVVGAEVTAPADFLVTEQLHVGPSLNPYEYDQIFSFDEALEYI